MSAAIAGGLIGVDLVKLAKNGRIPPGELRQSALAVATLLAAIGLTSRHTLRTLQLARRIEHARSALDTAVPVTIGANGTPVRRAATPVTRANGSSPVAH
jgi:hypothetical protein